MARARYQRLARGGRCRLEFVPIRVEHRIGKGSGLTIGETRFFGYLAYPLLGFPDLIDRLGISRWADGLIRPDRALGRVPALRQLGWGTIIAAHK